MYQHRSPAPRPREPWVYCLTAMAEVVANLPPLYLVVEKSADEIRIELRTKANAWEVLRFTDGGLDRVAGSLSSHLESPPAYPFPGWLADAIATFESDLEWAASRACDQQGSEVLSALVRFRAVMLRGDVF